MAEHERPAPDSLAGAADIPDVTADLSEQPTIASPASGGSRGTGRPATRTDDLGPIPEQVGSYRVVREIGRGGMGRVLMGVSEDTFKRRVAIKVIKRGMDTEDVLHRFDLERQLLAAMNHPGIARLYEAGETDGGQPYLVMEYIEGLELLEYCASHRLTVEDRLELFEKICEGVHYAHKNLVVHRDLKPSNIIVTKEGQPKLLDFGIAKIINPEFALMAGDPTAPEMRIMTPEYASPEQVRGHPVTTASDVYSLGVILYEVLTGHAPYKLHSRIRDDIERIVCDEEPDRPSTAISRVTPDSPQQPSTRRSTAPSTSSGTTRSTDRLRKRLAGDLDNIVLMAMRKEPMRRYQSAQELADDINRHRKGMPVVARPDTFSYRVSKFVRRHRGSVAAASLVAATLVAGLAGTASGWSEALDQKEIAIDQKDEAERLQALAEKERARADRRFDAVRDLANFFINDFHDAIVTLDGALPARELIVTEGTSYLEQLQEEVGDRVDLEPELAAGYERIGDIMGGRRNHNMGSIDDAIAKYEAALEIRNRVAKANPEDLEASRALAMTYLRLGDALDQKGSIDEAIKAHGEAVRLGAAVAESGDMRMRRAHAFAINGLAKSTLAAGSPRAALQLHEQELEILEAMVADGADNLGRSISVKQLAIGGRKRDLAASAAADLNYGQAEELYGEANDHYARALEIRKRRWEANPTDGRLRRDLGWVNYFISDIELRKAHLARERWEADTANEELKEAEIAARDASLAAIDETLQLFRSRVRDSELDARAMSDLAGALEQAGRVHELRQSFDDALAAYSESVTVSELLVTQIDSGNVLNENILSAAQQGLARVYRRTGDAERGIEVAEEALATMEAALKRTTDVRYKIDMAALLANIGDMHREDEAQGAALRNFDRARELYEEVLRDLPDHPDARAGYGTLNQLLAELMMSLNDNRAALEHAEIAHEMTEIPTATRWAVLAEARAANKDPNGAADAARQGLDRLAEEVHGPSERAGLQQRLQAVIDGA